VIGWVFVPMKGLAGNIVAEMTYSVMSKMLNPTLCICLHCFSKKVLHFLWDSGKGAMTSLSCFACFIMNSGQANVIAVKACIRHNDHIVIVMPYFEHDRFQVQSESLCIKINKTLSHTLSFCIKVLFLSYWNMHFKTKSS